MNRRTPSRGFTLIEVLVAVAILSFGLLGIAAMQVVGVRANQGSYFRSQATFIASDMAERLYSNRTATRAFLYDGFDSNGVDCASTVPTRCSVDYANTSVPAACTAATMATSDRFVTSCGYADGDNRLGGVKDLLPTGRLTVTCVDADGATLAAGVCTADSLRRVSVQWDERVKTATTTATTTAQSSGQSLAETQTVSLTVQP